MADRPVGIRPAMGVSLGIPKFGSPPAKGGANSLQARRARAGLKLGGLGGGTSEEDRLKALSNKGEELFKKFELNKLNNFESNYYLGKWLGEGCMGSVYVCYKIADTAKEHPYAVKTTREDDPEKKAAH